MIQILRDTKLSVTSAGNSTTSTLAGDATFTGTAELNDFPHVGVMCKSDVAGTLYFDFSNDGTNWDSTFPVNGFECGAGVSEFHTAVKLGRYFRVRYVNGSDAQSYLRLTTYYGNGFVPSVAPLNQIAGLDQDAIFTRSTVAEDEVALGRRSGVTRWNKWGYNTDVDTANEEILASFGGDFVPLTSAETFDISYDGTSGGSTDGTGTTGATELTFFYIDANGLPAIATHTLGTDGSDTTAFSGLGINRVAVSASGSNNTNASDIDITATTAGTNQAQITAGAGTTQQCLFFVGSNHTAILKGILLNMLRLSGGGEVRATFKGIVYNRAVDTQYEVFRVLLDTRINNLADIKQEFKLNATDVFWLTVDTDTNNTIADGRFTLNEYQNT